MQPQKEKIHCQPSKMKNRTVIVSFFVLNFIIIGCKSSNNTQAEFIEVDKAILDSLVRLTQKIPSFFDTSFSWIHYGDHGKSSDIYKYRFQRKSYPVAKETGWILQVPTDSVYQYTITHRGYRNESSLDTSKQSVLSWQYHFIKEAELDPFYPPVQKDTIEQINDRFFSIITMSSDSILHRKIIQGTTIVKGIPVSFTYEYSLSKESRLYVKNFEENVLYSLRSIRILE